MVRLKVVYLLVELVAVRSQAVMKMKMTTMMRRMATGVV